MSNVVQKRVLGDRLTGDAFLLLSVADELLRDCPSALVLGALSQARLKGT